MDVPGFARLLKGNNRESEVWWDAAPTAYSPFKNTLMLKYPDAAGAIERLMPDNFHPSQEGISCATTNPALIAQEVLRCPALWRDFVQARSGYMADPTVARQLYDQVLSKGARLLQPLWNQSQGAQGWLSAQIEGFERMSPQAGIDRGLQLTALAPNIMVKVPGSEEGYRVIEALVAQGCSVNNTFCFSVSQVIACLKAIHMGRLRARVNGVDTDRARYVISFMIGRLGAETEFADQARQRRISLTSADRRWAELAVYQAMQALLRRWQTPARLLLCSLKIDTDGRGREHCWHLQRTGADTTLYTLTPAIIEFLIRRQHDNHPIIPASQWLQTPGRVLTRLMAIPYFNQAYFEGGLTSAEFARYPAFITATANAREGHERLLGFVQNCMASGARGLAEADSALAMERAS